MSHAGITGYIDVAQIALYAFWIFFAGLIYYLRGEDKREGYPLESESGTRGRIQGYPPMPKPKSFRLRSGETRFAPRSAPADGPIAAQAIGSWPGSPLEPTGNPMLDGVGPASYANRANTPDLTVDGEPKIVPIHAYPEFSVDPRDPDPRGMAAVGADGVVGGTIRDIWLDRSDMLFRYYEVEVAGGASVLLPVNFTRVNRMKRQVRVASILGEQFADVPKIAIPGQVTFLEEDKITAYYASGHLYATTARMGPLL